MEFFIKLGDLKRIERRGWVLRKIKNPETIAAHTFRTAMMAWLLCCKENMNISKILKIALIHDICEVEAGDTTPYDRILPEDEQKQKELLQKWPRLSKKEKEDFFSQKYEKEDAALKKIIAKLPRATRDEINNLWEDYENGITKEGRFVKQLDRIENLLQALEYWKKEKSFAIKPWWIQIEELVDDPVLIKFMETLEEKFHKGEEKI